MKNYDDFLKSKIRLAQPEGFPCSIEEINPALKPHNKLMVKWMVEGGRRACFASFGLHKTVTQLEVNRIILSKTGGRGLIIAPLGVRQEFNKDAVNILGWKSGPKFIRRIEEADETGIYITNYETVRDGKLDPRLFNVVCLDEASILRGLGGSKTFREFMRLFTGYSRARWQMDAHGFTRSSGERLLKPEEVAKLEADAIYKLFKTHSLNEVWDFEQVVSIAEGLEAQGKLPSGFMLLQPQSWSDEVWTDIKRMLTLNGSQWSLGKEMHVCPMQFDIADRVIEQMSNPGDIVLDYFGGLGTVPLRAMIKGRKGLGIELNPVYFLDAVNYLKAEELKQNVPTLFDLQEAS